MKPSLDQVVSRYTKPARPRMPEAGTSNVKRDPGLRMTVTGRPPSRTVSTVPIGDSASIDRWSMGSAERTMMSARPAPEALRQTIAAAVAKAQSADAAELASFDADLADADQDIASIHADLDDYTRQYNADGPTTQVTYGTQDVDVATAIARTQRDIDTAKAAKQGIEARRALIVSEGDPYRAALANLR